MPPQRPNSTERLPVLQGRVFERLNRFAALPADVQEDTKQFQAFAEQNKHKLFENNYHARITSVYSVRGQVLVKTIIQWLQTRFARATHAANATNDAKDSDGALQTSSGVAPAHKTEASERTTSPSSTTHEHPYNELSELLVRAKGIAEALVLSGFLTHGNDPDTSVTASEYCLGDNELFIPVAKTVTGLQTTSVWSVIDGATYARFLKRKTVVCTHSKDVYVVMNDRTKKGYLFESDVAREPIAEMHGESVTVLSDANHFEFGVRVTTGSLGANCRVELVDAGTKRAQEEFLNAWLTIGAQYHENNIDEMAEANARGLAGPEASHNAKWNITTIGPLEISTANVAAAEISGIAPMKIYDTPSTSDDDDDAAGVTDPSHYQGNNAAAGVFPVAAPTPPTDPRLLPSLAGSGLGGLRLPLGSLVGQACKWFLDSLPIDAHLQEAFQFLAKPYYLYERRRRGPETTRCINLE